jgi:outer membrane protein TolC
VKQARANYYPQFSFSGIAKVGLSGATSALGLPGFPASPFYRNLAYSVNMYWDILDFGRTKHWVATQRALAESARFKSKEEQERVVLAVKHAYSTVLEAQGLQSPAEQTAEERKLTLRRVRASFEQGLQSQLEVSLAESSVAEAEGSLAVAGSAVGKGFAALRVAMGVEGAPVYSLQAPKLCPCLRWRAWSRTALRIAQMHRPWIGRSALFRRRRVWHIPNASQKSMDLARAARADLTGQP